MRNESGSSGEQVKHILHPSDFSEASAVAFVHALKFALITRSQFSMLHVTTKSDETGAHFPGVRETLERWGVIPPESDKDAVTRLGVDVRKVVEKQGDPVQAALAYLKRHPADLIVLATHQYRGKERWFRKSVAEPIARRAEQMTLFVPEGVAGFVSRANGSISLKSILIPVTQDPSPQPAIDAAIRAARSLQCAEMTFTLLHVGDSSGMPECRVQPEAGWTWNRVVKPGEVVETIVQTAQESAPGLIVMSTQGHDGFLDALRGNTTEQVLREAHCPLLAMPLRVKED